MKRFLPLLILCCLLLSACGNAAPVDISGLESSITRLEDKCAQLETANAALQTQVDNLQSQIDTLAQQLEAMDSGSIGAFCNLIINNWEVQDGALVLTNAVFHTQAPADAQLESAQLVLTHNDSEIGRLDITLESSGILGNYQVTLNDTWFLLPELQPDDVLDLHPEVVLSNGVQLIGGITSWFASPEGLHTVVG